MVIARVILSADAVSTTSGSVLYVGKTSGSRGGQFRGSLADILHLEEGDRGWELRGVMVSL